jgi:hypothetical protein
MDTQKRKAILIPTLAVICLALVAVQFLGFIPRGLCFVAFHILELILGCWALVSMRGWRASIFIKMGLAILVLPGVCWALWWFGFMFYFFFIFRF